MSKIKDFFGKLCGKNEISVHDESEDNTAVSVLLKEKLEKRGAVNPQLAAVLLDSALKENGNGELSDEEITEAVEMLLLSEPYMFRSESTVEARGAEAMSDPEETEQEIGGVSTGGDHTGAVFSADMLSDSDYYRRLGI